MGIFPGFANIVTYIRSRNCRTCAHQLQLLVAKVLRFNIHCSPLVNLWMPCALPCRRARVPYNAFLTQVLKNFTLLCILSASLNLTHCTLSLCYRRGSYMLHRDTRYLCVYKVRMSLSAFSRSLIVKLSDVLEICDRIQDCHIYY